MELIEHKRVAADAAQRLPPYRERLGAAFAFEGEIAAKRQELDDINASLAANTTPARIKLPPDPLPRLLPGLDISVG